MSSPTSLIPLRAGRVTAQFDPATLWLNHLRLGRIDLLRAIYPAYRDTRWGTPTPILAWIGREIDAEDFLLRFTASYPGLPFTWELELIGTAEGRIRYHALGKAAETLLTNRAGFCVLHAASIAGQLCRIEPASGGPNLGAHFPKLVSPHQPFLDLRALTHFPGAGTTVRVLMEGEVFETEDQRNWTDASFKTYCRPLALPMPYSLEPGAGLEQQITMTVTAASDDASTTSPGSVPIRWRDLEWHPLPELGVLRTNSKPLTPEEAWALSGFRYLRADLDATESLSPQFQAALADAKAMKCGLEVGLYLGEGSERYLAELAGVSTEVRRWLVFGKRSRMTEPGHLDLVRNLGLTGPVGGGSDGNFVDVNRGRPFLEGLDFAGFPMQPQQHSFDDLSVLENAGTHGEVIRSAHAQYPGLEFRAPSVSLCLRRLPWEHDSPPLPISDARLQTEFGAAWTMASLVSLIPTHVPSITLHGTTGPCGLLDVEGEPTPIWSLLGNIYGIGATEVAVPAGPSPDQLASLMLKYPGGVRFLAVNLTAEVLAVEIDTQPYLHLNRSIRLMARQMYWTDIPDRTSL